ncbi:MAG: fdrA domain protein [Chloroflexi bacterium]|nr:fdrA domain protein [Chloroflexota bacterium]
MSVNDLFKKELKIVNMGLKSFYADFKSQNVTAVHVNWKPKAGGKKKMLDLLGRLNKSN